MKKRILFLTIVLFSVIIFSGCSQEKYSIDKGNLKVTVTYWSGWNPDYEFPAEEYYFDVKTSDTIVVEGSMTGDMSFEIKKVSENEIKIQSEYPLSVNNDSRLNFNGNQRDFTIKQGEPLYLTTITLDAGTNYTFEVCG